MLGRLLSHGDDLQRDHVAFGVVDVAEEVGDAFAVLLRLARQGEARQFGAAVLLEDDQVVALARREPIAVGGLRLQDALRLAQRQHAPHHRTQLLLRPAEEIVQRTALLPEAPLELVQAALVDERHDRLRCRLDDARAPERRRRHRHVARQTPAPRLHRADIHRTERARIRLAQRARRIARLADALGLHRRQVVVEPVADHLVHQVQAVERIARHRRRGRRHRPGRSRPRHSRGSAPHRPAGPESPAPGATSPPGSRASPRWTSPAGPTCRSRAPGAPSPPTACRSAAP